MAEQLDDVKVKQILSGHFKRNEEKKQNVQKTPSKDKIDTIGPTVERFISAKISSLETRARFEEK